ncbi:hypothetical protein [Sphingomonas sp. PWP1-2]|uniref:hypothetical protein n=1 Tax=Sphingomonas sp. PWP1-2 TaxID=2804558 RepID=UPI003CEFFBD5
MGIAEHFRIHGAVHAFWIISILVLIITALLLLVPNGSFLRDYISFASSIASIILAIIAIFYSMFSNQSFSEMVGSLQSSVQNTSQSSAKLEDASNFLTTLADRVSTEISSLSPRFDAVENKIEKGLLTDRIVNSSNLNGKMGQRPIIRTSLLQA